ncbi:MAG: hypothetical protein JW769_01795 [Parachlamydiales bacterium]|nr:hypothetical protein [Parachlamydiales bacterium]
MTTLGGLGDPTTRRPCYSISVDWTGCSIQVLREPVPDELKISPNCGYEENLRYLRDLQRRIESNPLIIKSLRFFWKGSDGKFHQSSLQELENFVEFRRDENNIHLYRILSPAPSKILTEKPVIKLFSKGHTLKILAGKEGLPEFSEIFEFAKVQKASHCFFGEDSINSLDYVAFYVEMLMARNIEVFSLHQDNPHYFAHHTKSCEDHECSLAEMNQFLFVRRGEKWFGSIDPEEDSDDEQCVVV